jgi:hypothetical protein
MKLKLMSNTAITRDIVKQSMEKNFYKDPIEQSSLYIEMMLDYFLYLEANDPFVEKLYYKLIEAQVYLENLRD